MKIFSPNTLVPQHTLYAVNVGGEIAVGKKLMYKDTNNGQF